MAALGIGIGGTTDEVAQDGLLPALERVAPPDELSVVCRPEVEDDQIQHPGRLLSGLEPVHLPQLLLGPVEVREGGIAGQYPVPFLPLTLCELLTAFEEKPLGDAHLLLSHLLFYPAGLIHPPVGIRNHMKGVQHQSGQGKHLVDELHQRGLHVDAHLLHPLLRNRSQERPKGGDPVVLQDAYHPLALHVGHGVHHVLVSEAVLVDTQVDITLFPQQAGYVVSCLPLLDPAQPAVGEPQFASRLAEALPPCAPQRLLLRLPGQPGMRTDQFMPRSEAIPALPTMPAVALQNQEHLDPSDPGVKHPAPSRPPVPVQLS